MDDLRDRIKQYPETEIIRLSDLTEIFSGEEFSQLLDQSELKSYQLDLYYRPRQTRFGELGPSSKDLLTFIFKTYPHTFMGGHRIYNSWGFSQQVPNLTQLWSNQAAELSRYHFDLIEVAGYIPPINPEFRKAYPFLELMKNNDCFWVDDYQLSDQVNAQLKQNKINNFVKQLTPEEKMEVKAIADKFYSPQVVEIIKKLLLEK